VATLFAFGLANWIPIAGDWAVSGHSGIGMFDPTSNTFYLENDPGSGKVDFTFQYGAPGWIPVAGDWTGIGHTGIGMFDPATMTWYLRNEVSAGPPDAATPFAYGAVGWKPVTGDWNGDGKTTIGLFDPVHFTWYLRNENNAGPPDAGQFAYGFTTWAPVGGVWTVPAASGATPASAHPGRRDAGQRGPAGGSPGRDGPPHPGPGQHLQRCGLISGPCGKPEAPARGVSCLPEAGCRGLSFDRARRVRFGSARWTATAMATCRGASSWAATRSSPASARMGISAANEA
jgi:hypothetical protein